MTFFNRIWEKLKPFLKINNSSEEGENQYNNQNEWCNSALDEVKDSVIDTVDILLISPKIKDLANLSQRVWNWITYEKFKEKFEQENLNIEEKNIILKHIIWEWKVSLALKFISDFDIDTSFLEFDLFEKWYLSICKRIWKWIKEDDVIEYLLLCNNIDLIYDLVSKTWRINILYELRSKNNNLPKFSDSEMDLIFKEFKNTRDDSGLFFFIWKNAESILNSISINPQRNINILKDILIYTEKELKIAKDLFKDTFLSDESFSSFLNTKFNDKIENLVWSLESLDLQEISREILKDKSEEDYINKKIKEFTIDIANKNITNDSIFSIYFDSFENKMKVLILQWKELYSLKEPVDYIEIYTDKNSYFSKLKEVNKDYFENLRNYNIPYWLFFFKTKWWRDEAPITDNTKNNNIIEMFKTVNDKFADEIKKAA